MGINKGAMPPPRFNLFADSLKYYSTYILSMQVKIEIIKTESGDDYTIHNEASKRGKKLLATLAQPP
jgi:hypothetical protein